ncbi:hypothetical protein [Pseudovibrio sp. SPO723]|uniref:radical SAM protein n=1 Tax=Nesiotobacter zosterae TaxID=392721 RepID=UPI0029C3C37E|nr:hypothetical protein [Pseudovibrio sp. SPO723]MDX5594302.1 hypothetical protein [Pseudovibrio sp. SPO723]
MINAANKDARASGGFASLRSVTYKKWVAQRISHFLSLHPQLEPRYAAAKKVVRAFRRPAFYEISTRCNLKCEGCYYFEGGQSHVSDIRAQDEEWAQFFKEEQRRGVSMAYFVGAEPALEPKRLMAAAECFPWGNIGSNGTIRIPSEVPYRIGVSVWAADEETDRVMRGAGAFRKALMNYAGDPRAIILFTVSRWTIDHIPMIAQQCREHGLPLTFNIYSPTHSYLEKLKSHQSNDQAFFRVSAPEDNPQLGPEDLYRMTQVIEETMDRYPETVIYDRGYNRLMSAREAPHAIDPATGIAENCGSRMVAPMRYFGTNRQQLQVKCGTSDVDCSQCRLYSGGWSSRFVPSPTDLEDLQGFKGWLDTMDVLGRIFLIGAAEPYHVPAAESADQFAGRAFE